MKTANETMTAADVLKQQIDAAEFMIQSRKKTIEEAADRIQAMAFDACKHLSNLSGGSLSCHATNIIAFATQMAQACSDLQQAQDWKRDAKGKLDFITNG
jgi:hypothetical protein